MPGLGMEEGPEISRGPLLSWIGREALRWPGYLG